MVNSKGMLLDGMFHSESECPQAILQDTQLCKNLLPYKQAAFCLAPHEMEL